MRSVLPRSLYIHVPFCARRCAYCDFAVQATSRAPTAEWVDAIAGEWELLRREQGWIDPLELDTIYIGGGTPSLLGAGAMAELAARLKSAARWNPETVEWTCEANPESFTPEVADDWRRAGVNRISLGVQSFHEPALRWMGRLHGAEGAGRAVSVARATGLGNLSIDLIFGLPERLGRNWTDDLDRALQLDPAHISLYGLTAEPATPLGRWVREGREQIAPEDRYAEEYLEAHERLVAAGFEHYEVSNFARPGYRSRHNGVYWSGLPFAALGPGAHAYYPPRRCWNLRDWSAYRNAVRQGRLPREADEIVSPEDRELERVWLALRTRTGLPLERAVRARREMAMRWVREGLATLQGAHDGALVLSARGWLLLDRLAVDWTAAGEVEGQPELPAVALPSIS